MQTVPAIIKLPGLICQGVCLQFKLERQVFKEQTRMGFNANILVPKYILRSVLKGTLHIGGGGGAARLEI